MSITEQLDLFEGAYQPEPTAPYVVGSETSRDAAEAIRPSINRLQLRVLRAISRRAGAGLTDWEIECMTHLNPSTVRPRRVELANAGLIEKAGATRATGSGRQAQVWVATAAGRLLAESEGETP